MYKRAAIFYPNPNLSSIPSLHGFIENLAEKGFQIDVFTEAAPGYGTVEFSHAHIRCHLNYTRWIPYGLYRLAPRKYFLSLMGLRKHLKQSYDVVVGVDPLGVHHADVFSRFFRCPLFYFSLEVMALESMDKIPSAVAELKQKERAACKRCTGAIIQDPERGSMFEKVTGITSDRHLYLPNAPRTCTAPVEKNVWHKKFDLPENTKVLLHAGSLMPWTGVVDAVAGLSEWPEDWVLVIHGRQQPGSLWSYVGDVIETLAPPGRVYFSRETYTLEEMHSLYASADAVLALYWPNPEGLWYDRDNIQTLGRSSGKCGYALQHSVPVITNRATTLGTYIEEKQCGDVVTDAKEIGEVLSRFEAGREALQARAASVYEQDWIFEKFFSQVYQGLTR